MHERAGRYIIQLEGYKAFIPNPLPPDPPLNMNPKMQVTLSAADRAIGRLDAATELIPNPDLFVAMYVRKEAVYSSQIEGTQASLIDLLEFEAKAIRKGHPLDVKEVVNYIKALNYGLDRLRDFPLSLRLLREVHAELLLGVRGDEREPGEFRRSQNWIGPAGCLLSDAVFVPPPPQDVTPAMGILEKFLHKDELIPPLIKCGLVHGQFETIHPFLDGNGRMGRLLITFLLCWYGIIKRPLLYISHYFKKQQDEYYTRLQRIRDQGDWEGWILFFLEAVRVVSLEATDTAQRIQNLRDEHRAFVGHEFSGTAVGLILLDHLFARPVIRVNDVAKIIERSYPIANDLVLRFEKLGLLKEMTGRQRNRVYSYEPYRALFE